MMELLAVAAAVLLFLNPAEAASLDTNLWFNLTVASTSGIFQYMQMVADNSAQAGIRGNRTTGQWEFYLEFFGKEVYLYGNVYQGAQNPLKVEFKDNAAPSNNVDIQSSSISGMFLDISGFGSNDHVLGHFRPVNGTRPVDLAVHHATVKTGMVTNAPTIEDVARHTEYFVVDNKQNPNFTINSDRTMVVKVDESPQSNRDRTMVTTLRGESPKDWEDDTEVPWMSVSSITVPDNTAFLILNGSVGKGYWDGELTADPAPDFRTIDRPETKGFSEGLQNFCWWDPEKPYEVANEVLTFAPLDPKVQYRLSIRARGNNVGLHSITFLSGDYQKPAPPTTSTETTDSTTVSPTVSTAGPSSEETHDSSDGSGSGAEKSNKSAIIGGVIAGIVGIILLIGATWLVASWQVRRRRENPMRGLDEFEIDDLAITPFLHSSTDNLLANASPMEEMGTGADGRSLPEGGSLGVPGNASISHRTSSSSLSSAMSESIPPAASLSTISTAAATKMLQAAAEGGCQSPSPPAIVIRETDGGSGQTYEYVPPLYDPQWAAERSSVGHVPSILTDLSATSEAASVSGRESEDELLPSPEYEDQISRIGEYLDK